MSKFVLWIAKDGKADHKHCKKELDTQEALDTAYEQAKKKYNAKEEIDYGAFKFATGHCKHNKEVNMSYNADVAPSPTPKKI